MLNQKYVLDALKAGFSETQISEALGCTPSAVHQCISDNGLKALASTNSRFQSIDEKYNTLEEKALNKLEKSMEFAALNPIQACRVINTLNSAKRRSLNEGHSVQNATLVQLTLPARHAPRITKNEQGEVIEVNGRVLSTLPASELETKGKEHDSLLEKEDFAELIEGFQGKAN